MLLLQDEELCRVRLTEPLRRELRAMLTEQIDVSVENCARFLAFLKEMY